MKVNVHFFVNEATGGTHFQIGRVGSEEELSVAYRVADNILTFANNYSTAIGNNVPWNQAYWGATVTSTQCAPVRYVLEEVFIHYEGTGPGEVTKNDIRTDSRYEEGLNLIVDDATVNGFVYAIGGRTAVIGNYDAQNSVHEFGHLFNLQHTFRGSAINNDGCLDTWWRPRVSWDADADGVREYPTLLATDNRCWNDTPQGTISSGPNGIIFDYCDTSEPLINTEHPCCSPFTRDNNVMTHSGYNQSSTNAAFTPCQIERALTDIVNQKCDIISAVNPICPPVNAHLGLTPTTDTNYDCNFCFYLEGTYNEDDYRIFVEEKNLINGNYSTYYDTGWKTGRASQFCVRVIRNFIGNKFSGGKLTLNSREYRISIEARNTCSNDVYSYEFSSINACDPGNGGGGSTSSFSSNSFRARAYPNPFQESTTLTYDLLEAGNVNVWSASMGIDGSAGTPNHKPLASGLKQPGTHSFEFDRSEMTQGLNYIFIRINNVTEVITVIKQ